MGQESHSSLEPLHRTINELQTDILRLLVSLAYPLGQQIKTSTTTITTHHKMWRGALKAHALVSMACMAPAVVKSILQFLSPYLQLYTL